MPSLSRLGRTACVLLALAAGVGDLRAQQVLHGVVRDSASGMPVSGAIVTLLDSAGTAMTRNLSNERGLYRATLLVPARRVRVVRLGFRPRELAIPPATNGEAQLDVTLQTIPFLLEPVRVSAGASCPKRADRAAALSLLEQARAGLLATVVSRAQQPARMTRLIYERTLDRRSERPTHQAVRVDSSETATSSFDAALTAAEFVRHGFMRDSAGSQIFLAPDAEVLLDDAFASAYCFHLMPTDHARPTHVGLGFRAARMRMDRVEIDGALWIDTVARALDDIEFRYVGLGRDVEALRPGGRVAFRDMGNGAALVDQWMLRLVGANVDSVVASAGRELTRVPRTMGYYATETGGELAQAVWPDGRSWDASLGTLQLHAIAGRDTLAVGTLVGLEDTGYRAVVDARGDAAIPQLVPGPYTLLVHEPRLAAIGVSIPTGLSFVAERGATVRQTLRVPSAEEYVARRCLADRRFTPGESVRVVGRVLSPRDEPVPHVSITLAERMDAADRPLPIDYVTGTDGIFQFCTSLRAGMTLRVRATAGRTSTDVVRVLGDGLTVVPIWLDTGARRP